MAGPVRIVGKTDDRDSNEGIAAQVDSLGNLHVREGSYPGLNKVYEDTNFVTGDSPQTHDFNSDAGRNATDGYIICDGPGNIKVDYSRDGITFGEQWTMKKGEKVSLLRLDIDKIRITWVADSAYRINMV